ncbi:hypothetical protein [Kitasatospora viridis]|uniref:Uncharacterized protein n=1 Tax=Kitasatospora viridis TaxID=281105 RepID=A0A561T6P5_9ACTN|nr:hypothetical protein [Kitasatospora viridis]TWF82762.1 hypothetical protein FHX73_14244 [Kitasatospora viridis]
MPNALRTLVLAALLILGGAGTAAAADAGTAPGTTATAQAGAPDTAPQALPCMAC